MVTFLGVRIPVVGCVGVTDRCSFPIIGRGERARVGRIPRPRVQGNLGTLLMAGPPHGGGGVATNHGQLAIFADGAPAPLLTSFAASKSFYRSVDVTKAHDMTLAGDASFNGGIFLAMAAVDRALKV
jgi:hypothetical protein